MDWGGSDNDWLLYNFKTVVIMRKILSILMSCLCFGLSCAQSFNQAKALEEISAAAASIKTMQCDFVQTKSLKMLGDKMVSEGQMWCQQPNMLRWQYASPYTYTFILNNNRVSVRKGNHSDVIDVNKNRMFKEIARIMMNSVLGKVLTDKKDFKSSVARDGLYYIVTLIPQKKEMKQMFTAILLHYDTGQKLVTKVEMREKNGDSTLIEMKNIKKNSPINAAQFKID